LGSAPGGTLDLSGNNSYAGRLQVVNWAIIDPKGYTLKLTGANDDLNATIGTTATTGTVELSGTATGQIRVVGGSINNPIVFDVAGTFTQTAPSTVGGTGSANAEIKIEETGVYNMNSSSLGSPNTDTGSVVNDGTFDSSTSGTISAGFFNASTGNAVFSGDQMQFIGNFLSDGNITIAGAGAQLNIATVTEAQGIGTIHVAKGAALGIYSPVVVTEKLTFDDTTGTILVEHPLSPSGVITNMVKGDQIELPGLHATAGSYANHILTLYQQSTTVASIQFSGNYTFSSFALSNQYAGTFIGLH
jgi:hypothetical protein